ncbi:MAG: sigma-70 family RNA polymerase sigma factor [Candidatus Pacebacteria bacterium]|nr:sigma-70 family RNA polymerase sigma factor [Candidatus Paceibacterota bacterium]
MKNATTPSDDELIVAYRNGDKLAFDVFYKRHISAVYKSVFLLVKDSALAEDITQNTFIRLLNVVGEDKFRTENNFRAYLVRVAHNLCIDYFRIKKRMVFIEPDSNKEDSSVFDFIFLYSENKEDQIISSENKKILREAIKKLPPEQREVVELRYDYELSFWEISILKGESINTWLGRMRYALINLRKLLEISPINKKPDK